MANCPECYTHNFDGTGDGRCAECHGTGRSDFLTVIIEDAAGIKHTQPCGECNGTKQCQTCGGTGEV